MTHPYAKLLLPIFFILFLSGCITTLSESEKKNGKLLTTELRTYLTNREKELVNGLETLVVFTGDNLKNEARMKFAAMKLNAQIAVSKTCAEQRIKLVRSVEQQFKQGEILEVIDNKRDELIAERGRNSIDRSREFELAAEYGAILLKRAQMLNDLTAHINTGMDSTCEQQLKNIAEQNYEDIPELLAYDRNIDNKVTQLNEVLKENLTNSLLAQDAAIDSLEKVFEKPPLVSDVFRGAGVDLEKLQNGEIGVANLVGELLNKATAGVLEKIATKERELIGTAQQKINRIVVKLTPQP